MIDINQPVEQGADVVLNEAGNTHLGTVEEYDAKRDSLIGVDPSYKAAPTIQPKQPLDLVEEVIQEVKKAVRDAKGHFIKK